jgi:anthranilate phosphoribosyltransferase
VFNFLGPLANPARPAHQAVGVADARMAAVTAAVLAGRGVSALVFRGEDGLDELTTAGSSQVWVVRDGEVTETSVHPSDVGVALASVEDLRGADAAYNAAVARRFLDGEAGPVRDAVLLNAAAALVALEPGDGSLAEQLGAAITLAAESVDSGRAAASLASWVDTSRELAASPR